MMRLLSLFGSRVAPLEAALRCKYVPMPFFRAVNAAAVSEIQRRIQEPVAEFRESFESKDCITEVLKSDPSHPDWKECPQVVTLDRVLTALRTTEVEHDGHWNHW